MRKKRNRREDFDIYSDDDFDIIAEDDDLEDFEDEVGYDGDLLTKRKECLTKKCNSVFANDAQAKEGCLFLATWMEAAGNPNHEFKEVECPQALKAKW